MIEGRGNRTLFYGYLWKKVRTLIFPKSFVQASRLKHKKWPICAQQGKWTMGLNAVFKTRVLNALPYLWFKVFVVSIFLNCRVFVVSFQHFLFKFTLNTFMRLGPQFCSCYSARSLPGLVEKTLGMSFQYPHSPVACRFLSSLEMTQFKFALVCCTGVCLAS